MDAMTRLTNLLISEVSIVTDPANEVPGFMVMKSRDGALTTEQRDHLKLLLSPDEVAKAAEIEQEGVIAELERRGLADIREVLERVRDEFYRLKIQNGGSWR